MKRFLALACGVLLCGSAAPISNGNTAAAPAAELAAPAARTVTTAIVDDPHVNSEYISPLVTLRADPYLYKHEGTYYFTGSHPLYDRIELTSADSVNGVAAAVPKQIWHKNDGDGAQDGFIWAPEIHYIMGRWIIYFAYSIEGIWDIKCCALECTGQDPMQDAWEYKGKIQNAEGDTFFNQGGIMNLDMTVFENNGEWYAIWAEKPGTSNLYIARFEKDNPLKFATAPLLLSTPTYSWEKSGENVDEGPAVLKHAGKIFVSFSGSATGENYCMGLLEIDACEDPLDISNWTKYDMPVFRTDPDLKIYGPGHNCFVEGDNGEQLCIVHFRDYSGIKSTQGTQSLFDYNRHAHVMKVTFDRRGMPQFTLTEGEVYNSEFSDHIP